MCGQHSVHRDSLVTAHTGVLTCDPVSKQLSHTCRSGAASYKLIRTALHVGLWANPISRPIPDKQHSIKGSKCIFVRTGHNIHGNKGQGARGYQALICSFTVTEVRGCELVPAQDGHLANLRLRD